MVLGIIVTDENHLAGHTTHLALKLNRNYKSPREFHLVAVLKRDPLTKEEEIWSEENPTRKKQDCKPLYFGTVLKWAEYEQGNLSTSIYPSIYEIVANCMYETRVQDGLTQVKMNGIMSRNRQVFWMHAFPNLQIPYSLRKKATPDVAVYAWVTLQILPNLLLRYELYDFAGLATSFQYEVRKTPWYNEEENRNIRSHDGDSYESSSSTIHNIQSPYVKSPSLELCGIDGIVLSSTSIIAIKYPNIAFKKVVVDNDPLPPAGTYVKLNARWLDFVGYYAITSAKIDYKSNMKPLGATPDGLLRVTIKKCADLPGLFLNDYLGIYIDDPENILEVWNFSKFSGSSLSVAICDGSPDRNGLARYFIVEITDKKEDKLAATRVSGEMKLENCSGLVIDRKIVYICKYPHLNIRLSKAQVECFPIGTVVRITAHFENEDWTVSNITTDNNSTPFETRFLSKDNNKKRTFYRVPSASGVKELPRCIQHPIFGLMTTPPTFVELRNANNYSYDNIWVTSNDSHPGDIMLPPFRFQYYTSGTIERSDDSESCSISDDISDVESIASSQATTLSKHRRKVRFAESEVEVRMVEASRSECFANNLNIPETSKVLSIGNNMDEWPAHIESEFKAIVKSDDWRKNPEKKVNDEIKVHVAKCETCRDRKFGESCFFPDLLAKLILEQPKITDLLAQLDMFSFIFSRRFKT